MMFCSKCGKENSANAVVCASCGAEMAPSSGQSPALQASAAQSRTSGLAVWSLILGILGLLTLGITGFVGLVLGIVGLVQIGRSGGALKGRGLAICGIVVSAIMVIVVPILMVSAILFPVFSRARDTAVRATCVQNLSQIGKAMRMYASDNDDQFPLRQRWCDALQPDVGRLDDKAESVFQCPKLPAVRSGYAYNASLSGIAEGRLDDAASLVGAFDGRGGWNSTGGAELLDPRHRGTANVLYADGHVMAPQSLTALKWSP